MADSDKFLSIRWESIFCLEPPGEYKLQASHLAILRRVEMRRRVSSPSTMSAQFCVNPRVRVHAGYGPMRRSAMDSFLLGCIPVFFMSEADFGTYLPTFFRGWARNVSILIEPASFMRGEIDAIDTLAAVARHTVRRMQAVLAHHVHRLTYGLDEVHDDAVEVLLSEIFERNRAHWNGADTGHDWSVWQPLEQQNSRRLQREMSPRLWGLQAGRR
jgi:hypothetical protein